MITHAAKAPWTLRFAAPLAWRNDAAIATKLLGFAATEHGSALDMLRAAETVTDPKLRRLFFRHGLDEARHALAFKAAAAKLGVPAAARTNERLHAVRQDLLERLGLVRFVAFVWLSESRAAAQFKVLCGYFRHSVLLSMLVEAEIGGRSRKVPVDTRIGSLMPPEALERCFLRDGVAPAGDGSFIPFVPSQFLGTGLRIESLGAGLIPPAFYDPTDCRLLALPVLKGGRVTW